MTYGLARYQQRLDRALIDRSGRELPGHLDRSAGIDRPAVVIVHDFFGLTDNVKRVARQVAADGFIAFAPDLYHGAVATNRDHAAALAGELAWNRVAVELGLAVHALAETSPAIAICGFALGGAAALVAAAVVDQLAAVVTFYGIPQDVTVTNRRLQVQAHFAARDHKCTPPRIATFERMLATNAIPHELHHYDAANGFVDPTRPDVFSPPAADLAWQRTRAFLATALEPGSAR